MLRVKICGITRLSDALAACAAGADAVGFVFAESPRRVSVGQARRIASRLGPQISKVGVFVNTPVSRIVRTMKKSGLDTVQLHGDETPASARALRAMGWPVIKAVRVGARPGLFKDYPADAFLFDTAVRGLYGGSGRSFDWRLLKKIRTDRPIIVSGGLRPGNVKRLLRTFKPYGVDVSGGVERLPGIKDAKAIREFIHYAKTF